MHSHALKKISAHVPTQTYKHSPIYIHTYILSRTLTFTGTTDVTVMHIEEGRYRVEGTEGSSSCGGMHIDSLLQSFVLRKMINQGIGYRLKSKVRPVEICLSVCLSSMVFGSMTVFLFCLFKSVEHYLNCCSWLVRIQLLKVCTTVQS
jgi:Hsp70 protein